MPRDPYDFGGRCWHTDVAREHAEVASEQLRLAMRKQFGRLAVKHGISIKDARLLLMNAVMP